ncbi:histone-lysine N-methyltransferase, H3 lysine-79 specific isoform X2 [Hyalella azteca]|uniref:Histone-lysine N-methyltransferase, H3 lysine-79 specific isoform X2 n=1 Tax=Hyalella azteca TaxID=294128 RepID=A0A8B7PMP5_HYAAZ|nr:histone-lysine N-methyltransferase, H3 lysine-79 specific isoform X2 [Hyalella azteca]
MPIASSPAPSDGKHLLSAPQQLDNRHLAVSNLSRNDSLRSERSDKRVSFNNDVGIKHIPRGANKAPAPPVPQKSPPTPDEWAGCAPVKRQPNNLTPEELEKEAAHLVQIVDSINCKASPSTPKKNREFSSRSLDRTQNRNREVNGINYTRITNPIIRHLKADVNRRESRRKEDFSDSDIDKYREARHKSVPNLLSPNAYEKTSRSDYRSPSLAKSSDNLVDTDDVNLNTRGHDRRPPHISHLSADNLLDVEPKHTTLNDYKSLGNIQYCDSDSTDLSHTYRPKVNQIIGRLNGNPVPAHRYTNSDVSTSERESSPSRRPVAPTRRLRHNNNKPFSYVQPNNNPKKLPNPREVESDEMYAQVNKHGLRQKLSMDSDYSAKIIITEDRPKNPYEGDDEAYETYQVQNNSFRDNRYSDYGVNLTRYDIDGKNNTLNNNINMSSVAVQTDMSKSLNKERRPLKGMAPAPPTKEAHSEPYRHDRNLKSDLPSADLVRQINHGFGRFDRSPSPPQRRAFSKSNTRHVVPLLSDTSDSEPEYRRRSDPLKKIRTQVLKEGHLQEDEAEEWEEREMLREQRDKRILDFNPNGMRPLTIDEVDAMSLELDPHGSRRLVVSQKSNDVRSSSLQTTHRNDFFQSQGERAYSEERAKASRPLRERSLSSRDVSSPRDKTLERNQKNNLEKEKLAQEKAAKLIENENEKKLKDTLKFKNKDKKGKEQKEKKKKKIKIKFFYDPRPQDKQEDPLTNFSEYKGSDRNENGKVTLSKTRSRSYDSRSPSRERKTGPSTSSNRRYIDDSSKDRSESRPGRGRNPMTSNNRHSESGNDRSSHEDFHDDRRRVKSSDSLARKDRYGSPDREGRWNRYEYERQDNGNRSGNNRSDNVYDREPEKRDNYDYYEDYNGREGYRNVFLQRRETYEQLENRNERKVLSDTRRERSPERQNATLKRDSNGPRDEENTKRYDEKNVSSPDEDGKQERVMRQRKKFLSALMVDGRAKSSNPPSSNIKTIPSNDYKTSNLKRSQSSVHDAIDRQYETRDVDQESDPQPPPSIASSQPKVGSRGWTSRTQDQRETRQWESTTLQRSKARNPPRGSKDYYQRPTNSRGPRRISDGSSGSSASPRQVKPVQVGRNPSFKQRYFGESDREMTRDGRSSGPGDYRSLPARSSRSPNKRPTRGGSAGSSLQSSESENDSHQGSRASHVSTGSNRSVYLHATAVADIPVQRDGESDRSGVQRQAKKVTRSFSLLAPWKPRHPREPHHIEYDSRDTRHAKPPRPPRKTVDTVGRSQTLTNKDSKLSGWLKKKKTKEGKGI